MRVLLAILIGSFMSIAAAGEMPGTQQGISLLGVPLHASGAVSKTVRDNLQKAKAVYDADSTDPDAIIWYGRRKAYTGYYRAAIDIFSEGIEKHPSDARFYRHRGHRYVSVRDLDSAIADLTKASQLINGTENSIEPDGIPNAKGIPVSSLHGNIWYHLGLAYYLKQDFEKALWAYTKARETSNNADNIVSTTHWLYMILRRLGREAEAQKTLKAITEDMPIIENFAYHQLCLFYKGDWTLERLLEENNGGPAGAGMAYGIANWHYYEGQQDRAKELLAEIIANKNQWPAFGYIAAEADLAARR